jgi:hypothetical protein
LFVPFVAALLSSLSSAQLILNTLACQSHQIGLYSDFAKEPMTPRQVEIAAESYTACVLAQAGWDVLVQYGANQPDYDLVANKGQSFLPVSVKGNRDGGWRLAVKYKSSEATYHDAIEKWREVQRKDVIFFFVQFIGVHAGMAPRVYVARPNEIAAHMKTQCHGRGHGSLQEDMRRHRPNSKYDHKIPDNWEFSETRLAGIATG